VRWYDPALGRFIQPDTLVPGGPSGAGDVQSFDRYAYVNNNPLKYIDPTGHQATCTMDAQNNMQCSDNAVTGGHTLTVDLADEPRSSNPDGTGFFMTMGGLLIGSLAAPFVAPYVAALLPAAAEGGTATVAAACADGNCTNEIASVTQVAKYLDRVSQIRDVLQIAQRRNVAIANYNIQGSSGELVGVSGPTVPGTVGIPGSRFFETFVVNHTREFDSEVKILETIAHQFANSKGVYENVKGSVTLFTELTPCPSCAGVIQQFQQMFPNVAVQILTGQAK